MEAELDDADHDHHDHHEDNEDDHDFFDFGNDTEDVVVYYPYRVDDEDSDDERGEVASSLPNS